jgi:hypothetical protein
MNRKLLTLAITILSGSLLFSNPTVAQELPPAQKAARVRITQGPALESAWDNWAIIRWTSNNPGGDDEHFGVVHYGTDAKNLDRMAKSHIRLNRAHPETIFRVRMSGLKPQTTYYYWVSSMGSGGTSDGVKSAINQFTTAAPGQRIVANP